ncbi:MAG: RNB domain-containing ribonuclease, partial [Thermodesulfobacteriota bacterium]
LVKTKKRNDSSYINMMVLRSLKKAVYSTKHIPHFGLAIEDYTHFTSPIRRYSDLIVHRVLDSIISKNNNLSYSVEELNVIAERCSIREREAEKIERESVNLESTFFMKDQVGNTFNAKVISIHPFGVFIELDDYFVEGLIPKQNYRVRGKKRVWFELGDKILVTLVEADILKRRLTFNIIND